jgi:hypothetical protein
MDIHSSPSSEKKKVPFVMAIARRTSVKTSFPLYKPCISRFRKKSKPILGVIFNAPFNALAIMHAIRHNT